MDEYGRLSDETLRGLAARWTETSDPLGGPAQAKGELLRREEERLYKCDSCHTHYDAESLTAYGACPDCGGNCTAQVPVGTEADGWSPVGPEPPVPPTEFGALPTYCSRCREEESGGGCVCEIPEEEEREYGLIEEADAIREQIPEEEER